MGKTNAEKIRDLIQSCDGLIRAGHSVEVKRLLADLPKKIERDSRLPIAQICRRVGSEHLGLKILTPVMQIPRAQGGPRAPEIAEYAVLLSRIGSIEEALDLLGGLNTKQVPELRLYEGFCHVSRRDHKHAQLKFKEYIAGSAPSYQTLIARVNLAAALVADGKFAEARVMLKENITLAEEAKAMRLAGNCWELLAQIEVRTSNFGSCRKYLDLALEIFRGENCFDSFFVEKWLAIVESLEKSDSGPLETFAKRAVSVQHWETFRELDLYRLKLQFSQTGFDRLYFGSPFQSFRDRLRQEFSVEASPSYNWPNGAGEEGGLDLNTDAFERQGPIVKALLRDFYTPLAIGALFYQLFPGEKFDIFTSPFRVRQGIYRFNRWAEAKSIGLSASHNGHGYQLIPETGVFIRIAGFERSQLGSDEVVLEKLKTIYGDTALSAKDIAETLGYSRPRCHRLLKSLVDSGKLEKFGAGPNTRYMIRAERLAA